MPTLFVLFGFKFLFYSNDHEPIHIHVKKGQGKRMIHAKFQVDPMVELMENNGFKSSQLKLVKAIVEENKAIIIEKWNIYFKTNHHDN